MRYWIGLGANLGDRLPSLRRAVEFLSRHGAVTARSRVFAASPVGGPPQPPFLNAALVIDSDLDPRAMLRAIHGIESELGRDRSNGVRWGPRTMDIDILLIGDRGERVIDDPDLCVPHARLGERAFALACIVDLDGTLVHPTLLRSMRALLIAASTGKDAVAATGDEL